MTTYIVIAVLTLFIILFFYGYAMKCKADKAEKAAHQIMLDSNKTELDKNKKQIGITSNEINDASDIIHSLDADALVQRVRRGRKKV